MAERQGKITGESRQSGGDLPRGKAWARLRGRLERPPPGVPGRIRHRQIVFGSKTPNVEELDSTTS